MAKISASELVFMLFIALIFDILTGLLGLIGLGILITPFASGVFWIWFGLKGVKGSGMRVGIGAALDAVTGSIPIINLLPVYIGLVIITYVKTKMEEKIPIAS